MKKHTKQAKSYRFLGSLLLVSGLITATLGAANVPVQGQLLTGQGSSVTQHPVKQPMLVPQETVFAAAPQESTSSQAGLIAFGALMMLLGFGLHAMIVLRDRDEFPVPVRIRQAFKKEPRTSRKQMEVIWVERTIRL